MELIIRNLFTRWSLFTDSAAGWLGTWSLKIECLLDEKGKNRERASRSKY